MKKQEESITPFQQASFEERMELIKNFRLPPDAKKVCEAIQRQNSRTLKDLFKGEIRGSFLIEIKSRVQYFITPVMFDIFDFKFSEERMIVGGDNAVEYDICKHIVGVHHANTVFMTEAERSAKEKDPKYKDEITEQVTKDVVLRLYGSAYFRNRAIIRGERFLYYPVPYDLFVLCMRMNEIFVMNGAINESSSLLSLITNKSMAALSLLEDNFLDSAYMPCRTVIEMFAKLMLIRRYPHLYAWSNRFAFYDLDKTCCSQGYSDEFNDLYNNRKYKTCKKVEYLHYGFVDQIEDYHEVVKQFPYTVGGILQYLKADADADEETVAFYERLESFYTMCHGYTHGNVVKARFPLLHYFEISMILGGIVPKAYKMLCEDNGIDPQMCGLDVLEKFEEDFAVLSEQYANRSTENFELEEQKYGG